MTSIPATKKRVASSPPPPAVSKKTRIETESSSSIAVLKKTRVESSSLSAGTPLAKKSRVEAEPLPFASSSPSIPANKEDKSNKVLREVCKDCLTGTFDVEAQTIPRILIGFALAALKSTVNKSSNSPSVEQYIQEKVLAISGGITEDPLVQNALQYIIKSAKGIISDGGKHCFWNHGGCFPVLQKISIMAGGSSIECKLFAFENDDPTKYEDSVVVCYFDALTKILYFLSKFPGFLFANLDAKQDYLSEKKAQIYSDVLEKCAANSEIKKREICDEIEKLKVDILEVERCKTGSLSVMGAIKREIDGHETKLNKVKTSFKTLMEDAMDCVEPSDEGSEIFRSMNEAGMLHLELVTQQLNFSIKEANERFEEMQKKFGLEETNSFGYTTKIEQMEAEIKMIAQVDMSELSASLPVQISNAIEAYLETFEPIMACAANATSMKALMVAMKEILLSKPVVMEGILSMKDSMNSYLENATSSIGSDDRIELA